MRMAAASLTVRVSANGGQSWSNGSVLHRGPSAYSDLVVQGDGQIGCLYECGEARPYERLVYARFDVAEIA